MRPLAYLAALVVIFAGMSGAILTGHGLSQLWYAPLGIVLGCGLGSLLARR